MVDARNSVGGESIAFAARRRCGVALAESYSIDVTESPAERS